jgi:hypothetical protein
LTDIVADVDIKPLDGDNETAIRSIAAFGESALYWVWKPSKAFQRPADSFASAKPISLNTALFCAT